MKAHRIELKSVPFINEVTGQQEPAPFSYRDAIKLAATSGGQRGMSSDDVIKAIELVAELKTAGPTIYLSPDDHGWLVKKVNAVVWTNASDAIAQFIVDIRKAPLVEVPTVVEQAA